MTRSQDRLDGEALKALDRLEEIKAGQDKTIRLTIGDALAWTRLEPEVPAVVWECALDMQDEFRREPEPEREPTPPPDIGDDLQLGPRLRYIRMDRGWTQRELSERCGISQRSITDYETGKADPLLPKLRRLMRALGGHARRSVRGHARAACRAPARTARGPAREALALPPGQRRQLLGDRSLASAGAGFGECDGHPER